MPTPIPNPFDPFDLPKDQTFSGPRAQAALRRVCCHGRIQRNCPFLKCQDEVFNIYHFGTPEAPKPRQA